jgi:riboflavin kinase / FMN adenylyltransferase
MQIIRNLSKANLALPNLVITIGNFDGVHLGHQKIISEVKRIAKEKNLSSAILTFEPHPISFFKPDKSDNFRISSLAQKLQIFQEIGVDYLVILPFNKKLSEISASDFTKEILVKSLNIKQLIIGHDFTFGKSRQGNFHFLEQQSKFLGFGLTEIKAIGNYEQSYSSTLIRNFICDGKISEANKVLGRNFAISGIIQEGRKLASQLGFPTANLSIKNRIIKPKFGVYKSSTFIPHLNQKFSSITNFGVKPTLDGDSSPLFETHIINFSGKIYGKKIIVELLDFIREEKKFASLQDLTSQIARDIKNL